MRNARRTVVVHTVKYMFMLPSTRLLLLNEFSAKPPTSSRSSDGNPGRFGHHDVDGLDASDGEVRWLLWKR